MDPSTSDASHSTRTANDEELSFDLISSARRLLFHRIKSAFRSCATLLRKHARTSSSAASGRNFHFFFEFDRRTHRIQRRTRKANQAHRDIPELPIGRTLAAILFDDSMSIDENDFVSISSDFIMTISPPPSSSSPPIVRNSLYKHRIKLELDVFSPRV